MMCRGTANSSQALTINRSAASLRNQPVSCMYGVAHRYILTTRSSPRLRPSACYSLYGMHGSGPVLKSSPTRKTPNTAFAPFSSHARAPIHNSVRPFLNGVESLPTFEQNQPAPAVGPGEILQSALTTFAYTLSFKSYRNSLKIRYDRRQLWIT